ncbi:MAG: YdbH domain-containing protein [Propionivibrio sp.]
MFPIRYRKAATWLLGAVCALALVWLALPRLLGAAAERWLAIPGIDGLSVDIAEIGIDRLQLRELQGSYRTRTDDRLDFALAEVAIDYSAAHRRIERVEIGRAVFDLHPSGAATPSPWPVLAWPRDLPSEATLRDFQITLHRSSGTPLVVGGNLDLRRIGERWQGTLRAAAGRLQIVAEPGEKLDIQAEWLPNAGPSANARLLVGRQPAAQAADLSARLPLPLAAQLVQMAGIGFVLSETQGEIALQAEAVLGETSGTLRSVSGEAEVSNASARIPMHGRAPSAALHGKLRFSWQAQQARLELLPGLRWEVSDDDARTSAAGRLERPFTITREHDETIGDGDFPIALRTAQWGAWDGTLQSARIAGGSTPDDWRHAETRLQVKGQLPRWQGGGFTLNGLQAAGQATLAWSPTQGFNGTLSARLTPERLLLPGQSPLRITRSVWSATVTAHAPSGSDFWRQLSVRGEASSPRVRVEFGTNAERNITFGPVRLKLDRLEQFATPQRGAVKADLSLAADAIHFDPTWPAPDLRARLRFAGDRVNGDGSLSLKGTEALRFSATHALARGCGKGTLTARQGLAALGKQLSPRPPMLAPLELQTGEIDADLEFDWCASPTARLDAKGTLHLRDADIGWEKAQAHGIQASVRLDGWQPLHGRIRLAAPRGQLATGTELSQLDLDLELTGQALSIGALSLNLLGGTVHSAPATLAWPPTGQLLPLRIDRIELGQLLDVFKVSGLSGSGRLDGVLPLAYADGALEVRDGRLQSASGGAIQYAPAQAAPDNIGLQVLRNLHFQRFDMRLNYASDGAYRTESTFEGSNPDFYDGYPIRFSLNVNGALPGLFRSALFSGDFNRHILEQLQSGKLR